MLLFTIWCPWLEHKHLMGKVTVCFTHICNSNTEPGTVLNTYLLLNQWTGTEDPQGICFSPVGTREPCPIPRQRETTSQAPRPQQESLPRPSTLPLCLVSAPRVPPPQPLSFSCCRPEWSTWSGESNLGWIEVWAMADNKLLDKSQGLAPSQIPEPESSGWSL